MLQEIISDLTAFLIGGAPEVDLPKGDPETSRRFYALIGNKFSYHAPTSKADKRLADNAMRLLLSTWEALALIDDLTILQKQRPFSLSIVAGHIYYQTDAMGATDIGTNAYVSDDITVYFKYYHGSPYASYEADDHTQIGHLLYSDASKMALIIFHELVHVWYFRFHDDYTDSGHGKYDENNRAINKPDFEARNMRFTKEIIRLDKSIRKPPSPRP